MGVGQDTKKKENGKKVRRCVKYGGYRLIRP
jgi:hypothetical protein